MYSKRELEVQFGIADTTVVRTLKAAGLSTSKRRYTAQEIEQFKVARQLFNAGYSVKEVHYFFSLKEVSYVQQEAD
jgi:DNA-binding transcriptional MerR regulator